MVYITDNVIIYYFWEMAFIGLTARKTFHNLEYSSHFSASLISHSTSNNRPGRLSIDP